MPNTMEDCEGDKDLNNQKNRFDQMMDTEIGVSICIRGCVVKDPLWFVFF